MGSLYARDPNLPPPAELETVEAWLRALPRGTVLIHEFDSGLSMHVTVEDVLDGMALYPVIMAMFDRTPE